jgi:hypothetical protein
MYVTVPYPLSQLVTPPSHPYRIMPSHPEQHPDDSYVSADDYCRLARLRITGRTLQNHCKANPHLAERIGEIRWPGKTMYDARTARDFRRHFAAAEKEFRDVQQRVRLMKPEDKG